MLNNVSLQGRISSDLELKETSSGTPVIRFSVATQRNYKAGNDYPTDFIKCMAWRTTAEFIERYFSKGQQIIVKGSIETRSWIGTGGNKHYETYILVDSAYFCEKKESAAQKPNINVSDDYEEINTTDDLPF
jgi:single-strand DNA-binding protein